MTGVNVQLRRTGAATIQLSAKKGSNEIVVRIDALDCGTVSTTEFTLDADLLKKALATLDASADEPK